MEYKIIDTHSHLWLKQDTVLDGKPVRTLHDGLSEFMGEVRQMLPPFMIDGRNSAEVFIANMNYAQVSAAVVVQEFIDGLQNDYYEKVQQKYPERFLMCAMCDYRKTGFFEEAQQLIARGFRAFAIPAHRLEQCGDSALVQGVVLPSGGSGQCGCSVDAKGRARLNGEEMMRFFKLMEANKCIVSICLAAGDRQVGEMEDVISECPQLKIAVGHFGYVTEPKWQEQIKLARHKNVFIESGGITWLFNDEFYPFHGAVRAIREAADLVGMEKLMWGSDYPRTITAITYKMSYDFIVKSKELSESEKALFLGLNAKGFYGFSDLMELPYIKNMSE